MKKEAEILLDEKLKKFIPSFFINVVEEPEQNLFPSSQRSILNSLLEFNNSVAENQLIITTHSPYILFPLNNCMMGGLVKKTIPEEEQNSFASHDAWIDPKKVSIYETTSS